MITTFKKFILINEAKVINIPSIDDIRDYITEEMIEKICKRKSNIEFKVNDIDFILNTEQNEYSKQDKHIWIKSNEISKLVLYYRGEKIENITEEIYKKIEYVYDDVINNIEIKKTK
jgi:hypothetical protein